MVGINLGGDDFRLFLVRKADPAALAVPVLAHFFFVIFAVAEDDLNYDRHGKVFLAMQRHVGLIHGVVVVLFLLLVLLFLVPVNRERVGVKNFIVVDLRAIDCLVEVPAQVFSRYFFNRLQEIFFGGMGEAILHEVSVHRLGHRVFADNSFER